MFSLSRVLPAVCGVFRGERDLVDVIEIGLKAVAEVLSTRSTFQPAGHGDTGGESIESTKATMHICEVTFVAYTAEEQAALREAACRVFGQ